MSHNIPVPPSTRTEAHIPRGFQTSFFNALVATALFRCWHILLFFAAWATLISVLNAQGHELFIEPTLLTVAGTVLGFVISYRTTASFERYNEGRRLWSQVIIANRTFARTTWFHIPDQPATVEITADEMASRSMIEKKTVINLLEAYAISLKHYLRGEEGIYYQDLYHLIKFLPPYALPAGIPPESDLRSQEFMNGVASPENPVLPASPSSNSSLHQRSHTSFTELLPAPVTSPASRTTTFPKRPARPPHQTKTTLSQGNEKFLLPARMPPKYHIFDLFPFSLFVKWLTKRGREMKGMKAAKLRAKMRQNAVTHNLPLEISLYLSSYIAALQNRKQADAQTINALLQSLNLLVDALAGLERILTNPIPFSYSIHLWVVTDIYCFILPLQIWDSLRWLTIPGTVILSFMFFGFLVAGEEIENPFEYDKNDLNLDHFTHNIIRKELQAITSAPAPDPANWVFTAENDLLFSGSSGGECVSPLEWMKRGHVEMQKTMNNV
ncbi:Bestrophin, RFP-TM, chloride channel-domain-containing protein [Lyophyllum atratum]|nr:Bestrophin, RFP-TM, chloride channel-domain-containing protein [Lyophyllum atratum]